MLLLDVFLVLLLPTSAALRSSGEAALDELIAPEMPRKRVAIIGAGAGGASTAFHLSQNAKDAGIPTDITIFERSSHIGGRTTTVNAWSDPTTPIELGASIFVEVNTILHDAAKHFNLSTSSAEIPKAEGMPDLGVWNGEEFVLITSNEDGWWEKAKLLWRYGLAPIRTNSLMKSTVGKFLKMYEEPLFPWKSLSEAAEEVGLRDVTAVTGRQFLEANGIGAKFADEVIQASTRVNYASNIALIHGLETMVCMATNGAMSIKGGNWQIFAHMLKDSATTHLNTTITKISKQDDDTFSLTTSSGDTSTFDHVVLSAPLQFSNLEIEPAPKHTPDHIPYVKLHVTLFASPNKLDPAAFNMEPGKVVPQYVLTTLADGEDYGSSPNGVGKAGFFSISVSGSGLNPKSSPPYRPEYIYKIFSPLRIDSEFLSKILGTKVPEHEQEDNGPVTWIYHKVYYSYPYEYPRVTFEEIKLDDKLWYTSGIESFISTMETSALMGKNVAKLMVNEWSEEQSDGQKEASGELKMQDEGEWRFGSLRDEQQKPIKAKL
ncbi:Prenylcysteine oxidase [Polyplosphaeria fusca]|uniref:Prenylcysteine oxidase n=1 Tax=Polyplosphaeria fusca TaxID=682080 RepID=A0A9P4V611_9PLEO|nr:Prenylcysteine oxidase [Polyplosphaeria fusca]